MEAPLKPLIVITGPTASGKTGVALRIAEAVGGEIICADSRTVYKGLDIGTAKPTSGERARVPHHLLDVVNPDERYSAARFQQAASELIGEIRGRGNVPLLVGGSGLYVDSVVLNYEFGNEPDEATRAELEAKTIDELLQYCIKNNITIPNNSYNKRYVVRAIEQSGINTHRLDAPNKETSVVAISTDLDVLKERIHDRATSMFESGVIEEATKVAEVYGWDIPIMKSPAYAAVRRLISNEISYEDAISELARADWQLARKQMTWLRRHEWLRWLTLEDVEPYVRSILAQ